MRIHLAFHRPPCCCSWRSTGLVVMWVWSASRWRWRMDQLKRNNRYPLLAFKQNDFILMSNAFRKRIWGQVAFLSKTSHPSATFAELVDVCAQLVHILATRTTCIYLAWPLSITSPLWTEQLPQGQRLGQWSRQGWFNGCLLQGTAWPPGVGVCEGSSRCGMIWQKCQGVFK